MKTYLLSRRNLVGSDVKEAEDVSPHKLTQMALDVAYGLRYIHSLKFVHRDLACRNCLVHSNGTVKIGDFGMTRPICDTDYYRFNKRGMISGPDQEGTVTDASPFIHYANTPLSVRQTV